MNVPDDRLLADFACLEPIYVDGVAGAANLGSNFAMYYFRWVPVKSENGSVLYQKAPAVYLIRPRTSAPCQRCPLLITVDAQIGPQEMLREAVH